MLNSVNIIISILATVVGIVGGVLGIYLIVRKGQMDRPDLKLNVGLAGQQPGDIPKKFRNIPPSIVVISPMQGTTDPLIAFLFVKLENRGKESVKNVRLSLRYKERYHVDNHLMESISQFEPAVVRTPRIPDKALLIQSRMRREEVRKSLEQRQVSVFGGIAQISCEIPIIRPGEKVIFYDLLKLQGTGPDDFQDGMTGGGGFQNVLTRIREIKSLKDFFVADIDVFAENHRSMSSRVSVLRFASEADQEGERAIEKFLEALWFGKRPKPGIYYADRFVLWRRRKKNLIGSLSRGIFRHELGFITFSEFAQIKTKDKQTFSLELPEVSQVQHFAITSPNCDYFNLPARVNNFETLMEWMGFPSSPLKLPAFRNKRANNETSDETRD